MIDRNSLSGLDQLLAMIDGRLDPPSMARTVGIAIHSASHGVACFRARPDEKVLNPMGVVHGGWYGAILDSAMGCAVLSTLPVGRFYTTLEYKVNLLRPIPKGAEVEARAEVQHGGRRTAVARAELRGTGDGKLFATGSTTCLILDAPIG